jgi:hypothetical protein
LLSLQSIESKGSALSILCKVFKTRDLMLFYAPDKNTRRLAGLVALLFLLYGVCQGDLVLGGWNFQDGCHGYIIHVSYFVGSG